MRRGWRGGGGSYLTSGNVYGRVQSERLPTVDNCFPRLVSNPVDVITPFNGDALLNGTTVTKILFH